MIPIEFIRFHPGTDAASKAPIYALTGGPGAGATRGAKGVLDSFAEFSDREIVIIDQRGTGKSNGLDCVRYDLESTPDAFQEMFEKPFFDPARFRSCMDELSKRADLRFYTTSLIADDIDDLRDALGHEQIILHGESYGTTLALEFIRRHGAHVRSAILAGVAPPSILHTETLAQDMDAMLEALFAACEADAACNAAFPAFRREFREIADRVRAAPIEVSLPHTLTNEPTLVRVRYPELMIAVRYALYSTRNSAGLPLAVHEAHGGDFRRLTALLPQLLFRLAEIGDEGMWASVRCAEEFPYIDDKAARAAAADAYLGTERLDSGQAICRFWPRGRAAANFHQPVKSDVPALLLAGEVDAATPPWMAVEAAKHLANAELVIVPNSSHWELNGTACMETIMGVFLEKSALGDEDRACLAAIMRPPFTLN